MEDFVNSTEVLAASVCISNRLSVGVRGVGVAEAAENRFSDSAHDDVTGGRSSAATDAVDEGCTS